MSDETAPNIMVVRNAIMEHSYEVARTLADLMVALGAQTEWTMEDNFQTTEEIARLAERIGLPSAGDQSAEDLAFWRPIAAERGIYVPDEDQTIGGPL